MKRLPAMAALQAFEAAARHMNFTRAAEELHLTHGAISRQVRQLELRCRQVLFERIGPQLRLTSAGEALRARLATPLQALHEALDFEQPQRAQALHVQALPSFSSAWLLPRLGRFVALHPHIYISLHTGYDMVSLPPTTAVVALRYGDFDRAGLSCDMLIADRVLPVATPMWFARHGRSPEAWPAEGYLRHTGTPWPARLPNESGRLRRLPLAAGLELNDASVLLDAAEQGLGVAWARETLALPRMQTGRLEGLPACMQDSGKAYWLACRRELAEAPPITAFRQWLLGEVQEYVANK